MNLDRVRVAWTGFQGAPGVSTFYANNGSGLLNALHNFYSAMAGILPADVAIQIENTGDTIDAINGNLVGGWVGAAQSVVNGTDAGVYAAPVGFLVVWNTNLVADSHHIRGRTFFVPAGSDCFDTAGQLTYGTYTTVANAAATLVSSGGGALQVWHRPRLARAAVGHLRALTAHDGDAATVTSSSVPTKAVVLRSRRD